MRKRRRKSFSDNPADAMGSIVALVVVVVFILFWGGYWAFMQTTQFIARHPVAVIVVILSTTGAAIAGWCWRKRSKAEDDEIAAWLRANQPPQPPPIRPRPVVAKRQSAPPVTPCMNPCVLGTADFREAFLARIAEIDWYQFEKVNAIILEGEGFVVERKGGAHPDGGVDIIATRGTTQILVQCKHWKSYKVGVGVIRELRGSMADSGVNNAALHSLSKEWTQDAIDFAARHGIINVCAEDLASRAMLLGMKTQTAILELLHDTRKRCPKCEADMILRTGAFWGCSTYPRCKGRFNA